MTKVAWRNHPDQTFQEGADLNDPIVDGGCLSPKFGRGTTSGGLPPKAVPGHYRAPGCSVDTPDPLSTATTPAAVPGNVGVAKTVADAARDGIGIGGFAMLREDTTAHLADGRAGDTAILSAYSRDAIGARWGGSPPLRGPVKFDGAPPPRDGMR